MRINRAGLWVALLAVNLLAADYKAALPGYRYEFPRDHFNHPDFQTEWWYYTGNLRSAEGRHFGFELTFFREALSREAPKDLQSPWNVQDLYLAHLALSDLDGGQFHHRERVNRAGPGLAGASAETARVWNGNWQVQWRGNAQSLEAFADRFALHLKFETNKPPVIHGVDGVSQKSPGPGHASHYISFTRLVTGGSIELDGKTYSVTGSSWMDHEFFTHPLDSDQTGWDWLSLQFNDNTELMLFRLHNRNGGLDPFSAGTWIDAQGKTTHLTANDFLLSSYGDTWKSPHTHSTYPVQWKAAIPSLSLELEVATKLRSQEIAIPGDQATNYWEGAIIVNGKKNKAPISGVGYLEMTGYDKPVMMGR